VRLFGQRPFDDEARDLLRRHSPLHTAHGDMPPMLLIHGTDEFLWQQGVDYAERLEELGVDHRLVRLEGAGHGMESWEGRPEYLTYKSTLVEWLDQKLRFEPEVKP
jgi:acetyl esterase/lipase